MPVARPSPRSGFVRSLGRRLERPSVALIVLCVSVLTIGVGALSLAQVTGQMTSAAEWRFARSAADQAAAVETWLEDTTRDVRLASRNRAFEVSLAGELGPDHRREAESAIAYFGSWYDLADVALIRVDGLEVARYRAGRIVAVGELSVDRTVDNPAFAPAIVLHDAEVHQTDPYVSPTSGQWVISLATPIIDGFARRLGLLQVELPVATLAELLAERPFAPDATNVVIDRAGRVLTDPLAMAGVDAAVAPGDADPILFPAIADTPEQAWRRALTAIHGRLTDPEPAPSRGTVMTAAGAIRYEALPILDGTFAVITTVPETTLLAEVALARESAITTIFPLAGLIVLLTGWFTWRLTRTNRRLGLAMAASSRLAVIVESADDAIVSIDPDGRVLTWNAGAARMYGLAEERALGSSFSAVFAPERRAELAALVATVVAGSAVHSHETEQVASDGSLIVVSLTLSPIPDEAGAPVAVSVLATDITERKRLEEQLAHQALHDGLTGLPNRALFRDRLAQTVGRRRTRRDESSSRSAVLFLDLDDFKVINDTLGHKVGDELLIAVAERIAECIRPGDTAARLGGDEFTVLLEQVRDAADARIVADRILERMAEPFVLDGHRVVVGGSIGIAVSDDGATSSDDLIRNADTALYEAKGNGKARAAIFDPSMGTRAWQRLEVEADLRRAIETGELTVHYQPIVRLADAVPVSVEALVRWNHPVRGDVPPGDFLTLAEQTGLIVPIGRLVRAKACRDLARWRREVDGLEDLTVAVNVAPRELAQPEFVDGLLAEIAAAGLPASAIRVEVTEGTSVEDASAIERLATLREHGVTTALDDFGKGYSSLGNVHRLPLDGLKIDRQFVAGLGHEPQATAIVTAAISFATALQLDVTAEGIETAEQLAALRRLGCLYGQGFLFARPSPFDTMTDLIGRLPSSFAAGGRAA